MVSSSRHKLRLIVSARTLFDQSLCSALLLPGSLAQYPGTYNALATTASAGRRRNLWLQFSVSSYSCEDVHQKPPSRFFVLQFQPAVAHSAPQKKFSTATFFGEGGGVVPVGMPKV